MDVDMAAGFLRASHERADALGVPLDRRVWLEASTLRDAGWQVGVIGPRGGPGMRRLREQVDGIEVMRFPQHVAAGLFGHAA